MMTGTRQGGIDTKKADGATGGRPEYFVAEGGDRRERSGFALPRPSEFPRRLVLISLVALIIAYLIWRAAVTLNPQFLAVSVLFFLADCLTGFSTIGLVVSLWNVRPAAPAPAPSPGLKVDVWIPTYNEDLAILRRTVRCCVRLDYPHRSYVLDDGNRPAVRELAEALGARYLAREKNEQGKAGNLNNALQHTDGDFIAVFDADFIPQRDFLTKLLGYFRDPRIALAQAPQHYYNLNSFQHRRLIRRIWNEQSSFFDLILQGRNNCNAVFWIGTSAVLRRRAVEDAGGFAVESVTEDMLTSIRLHARGWRSVYLNEPLAYGLAPVNVRQFLIQRLRWAKGASQIFFGHNPLFRKGLGARQRLCYLFSVMHFFDGAPRLLYYLLPALYLLFGISPITRAPSAIWVIMGYILVNIASLTVVSRRKISFFNDELYGMIRFLTYLAGNVTAFFRRRARFAVTPKDHRMKSTPFFILGPAAVFCLNVAALLSKGFLFLHGGFTSPMFLFSLILCAYFSAVAFMALFVSCSSPRTDSFLVHDAVLVKIAHKCDRREREEICLVEGWNDSSAHVVSRFSYPAGDALVLTLMGGGPAVSGIRARIAKKTVRPLCGDSRLYEYELQFVDLPEGDRLRLIDLVFQEGLRRQDWDVNHWRKVRFTPVLVAHEGEVLTSAGRTGGRTLVVRFYKPLPEGTRLPVTSLARPGRPYDFEVRSSLQLHGGVSLIGSVGRKLNSFRELRPRLPVKPGRSVHFLRLLPIVAALLGSAFLLDFSRRSSCLLMGDTGGIAPPTVSVVNRYGHLQVRDGALCGENGSPVRLRGLSSHGPQWFPFVRGATVKNGVACFGLEVIRVAVYVEAFKEGRFWNGYVAQPDYMLAEVNATVKDAINAGIYVIICWHIHSDPLEYASEARQFFGLAAARWGGYPNVLFEIANEPEGDIPWSRILRYAVGDPRDPNDGILDVIRRSDPDRHPNVVIVGTPFWSQRPDLALADPIRGFDNVMYALHFYAASHKEAVRAGAQKALDGGLPIFVTEWGTAWHLSDGPLDLASSRRWLDWMDRNGLSWINWSLSVCDETTSLLRPSAAMAGPWTDRDLTPSGAFVKAELKKPLREPRAAEDFSDSITDWSGKNE